MKPWNNLERLFFAAFLFWSAAGLVFEVFHLTPDMVARWDKNWFPYHLLDLEEVKDADGNVKGFVAGKHEGLVPYNLEAAKVQSIAELAPAEFVWLTTSEGSPGWAVGV